jgi:hypothetical protein
MRPANWIAATAVLAATVAATLVVAAPATAEGVTPAQLIEAGWSCRQAAADPTRLLCGNPGRGLPPRLGTPGFGDRHPSYELLVFRFATGEFIGVQKLLRPDIYSSGTPSCPQQPGGEYIYVPGIDLWGCFRPT